jgi:hypothetical protein
MLSYVLSSIILSLVRHPYVSMQQHVRALSSREGFVCSLAFLQVAYDRLPEVEWSQPYKDLDITVSDTGEAAVLQARCHQSITNCLRMFALNAPASSSLQ